MNTYSDDLNPKCNKNLLSFFLHSDVPDYEFTSTSAVAELKFDVVNMSAVDDFRSFGFEASVEFVRLSSVCDSTHRVFGASGELRLSYYPPMSEDVSHTLI